MHSALPSSECLLDLSCCSAQVLETRDTLCRCCWTQLCFATHIARAVGLLWLCQVVHNDFLVHLSCLLLTSCCVPACAPAHACVHALQAEVSALPVFGVGHSMGSLLHMLICARYAVKVSEAGRGLGLGREDWAVRQSAVPAQAACPLLHRQQRGCGAHLSCVRCVNNVVPVSGFWDVAKDACLHSCCALCFLTLLYDRVFIVNIACTTHMVVCHAGDHPLRMSLEKQHQACSLTPLLLPCTPPPCCCSECAFSGRAMC